MDNHQLIQEREGWDIQILTRPLFYSLFLILSLIIIIVLSVPERCIDKLLLLFVLYRTLKPSSQSILTRLLCWFFHVLNLNNAAQAKSQIMIAWSSAWRRRRRRRRRRKRKREGTRERVRRENTEEKGEMPRHSDSPSDLEPATILGVLCSGLGIASILRNMNSAIIMWRIMLYHRETARRLDGSVNRPKLPKVPRAD